MVDKQALRRRILAKLRQQSQSLRQSKSRAIAVRLRRLSLYRKARVVMSYVAIDGEVETLPILAEALEDGKRVVVPVVTKGHRLIAAEVRDLLKELKPRGPYRIPEPVAHRIKALDPKKLDLVIMPGLAFDRKGKRLGRGWGYFDRFLEKVPVSTPRVGLAFRFQMVKKVPSFSHDQSVTKVITD